MRETISTAVGFFVAPVISGVLFAAFTWATDKSGIESIGYAQATLLVGVLFSAVATLLVGVPAFFILRYFKLVHWWSAVGVGFVVGAVVAIKTEWPESDFSDLLQLDNWTGYVVDKVLALGATGAISAFSFWLIWKCGGGGSQERRREVAPIR